MAINNHPKKIPACDGNSTAGGVINDLDFPTGQRPGKAFETLRAAFALRGYALHRTDPQDGPVTYWVAGWGRVNFLPTIDAAGRFLKQIGGRL